MHFIIDPFTKLWWIGLLGSISYFVIMFQWGRRASQNQLDITRKILGTICLMIPVFIHPYLMYIGIWSSSESLPLHLCAFSNILAGLSLWFPNKNLFILLFYWGISGGIHSLLTPEVTTGPDKILLVEYYFLHTNIIFTPIFLMRFYGLFPEKRSWLKVFLWTQLALPLIGGMNYLLGANYMYLAHRPNADNPFIIGEWPWYIIGLEVAMIAHFWVIYKVTVIVKNRFSRVRV